VGIGDHLVMDTEVGHLLKEEQADRQVMVVIEDHHKVKEDIEDHRVMVTEVDHHQIEAMEEEDIAEDVVITMAEDVVIMMAEDVVTTIEEVLIEKDKEAMEEVEIIVDIKINNKVIEIDDPEMETDHLKK